MNDLLKMFAENEGGEDSGGYVQRLKYIYF